jgi:hypothetical protein
MSPILYKKKKEQGTEYPGSEGITIDSSVAITTVYSLDGRMVRVRVPQWKRFFFSPRHEVVGITVSFNNYP